MSRGRWHCVSQLWTDAPPAPGCRTGPGSGRAQKGASGLFRGSLDGILGIPSGANEGRRARHHTMLDAPPVCSSVKHWPVVTASHPRNEELSPARRSSTTSCFAPLDATSTEGRGDRVLHSPHYPVGTQRAVVFEARKHGRDGHSEHQLNVLHPARVRIDLA